MQGEEFTRKSITLAIVKVVSKVLMNSRIAGHFYHISGVQKGEGAIRPSHFRAKMRECIVAKANVRRRSAKMQ